jgi:hypothetical protein
METVSIPSQDSSPVASDVQPQQNQPTISEKDQTKNLLAEARNTRDMLVGFRAAVESGSFNGHKMMELAKGLAFLEAILNQNNAHIHNLQDRLEAQ